MQYNTGYLSDSTAQIHTNYNFPVTTQINRSNTKSKTLSRTKLVFTRESEETVTKIIKLATSLDYKLFNILLMKSLPRLQELH